MEQNYVIESIKKIPPAKAITYIICILSFTYFFYDMTHDYMDYQTITNYHFSDIGDITHSFLIAHEANLSLSADHILTNLRINQKQVKIKITKEDSNLTTFDLASSFGSREDLIIIWQNWTYVSEIKIHSKIDNQEYLSSSVKFHEKPDQSNYQRSSVNRFVIVKSLPAPYDTDCKNYLKDRIHITQMQAQTICEGSISCLSQNIKAACSYMEIKQHSSLNIPYTWNKYNLSKTKIIFENNLNIKIVSLSLLSLQVFIFCAISLIGTFCDFSVLDTMSYGRRKIRSQIKKKLTTIKQQEMNSWISDKLKYISYGLMFIAVIYQCEDILDDYFRYPHATSTYHGDPTGKPLPALTLCFMINDIMIDKNITIGDIKEHNENYLDKVTHKLSNYVTETEVQGINYNDSDFETFYWEDKKCFRLKLDIEIDIKYFMFHIHWHIPYLSLMRDKSILLLNSRHDDYLSMLLSENGIVGTMGFAINSRVITRKLLMPPYESKCMNLKQIDCIRQCIDPRSYFHLGINLVETIDQSCMSICMSYQCDKTIWNLVGLFTSPLGQTRVVAPNTITEVIFTPLHNITDILTYIISVIGFWSGICVLDSIRDLVAKILKIPHKLRFAFSLLLFGHIYYYVNDYMKYETVTKISFVTANFKLPTMAFAFIPCDKNYNTTSKSAVMVDKYYPDISFLSGLGFADPKHIAVDILSREKLGEVKKNFKQILFTGFKLYEIDLSIIQPYDIEHVDGRIFQPIIIYNHTADKSCKMHLVFYYVKPGYLRLIRLDSLIALRIHTSMLHLLPLPFATKCNDKIVRKPLLECYERKVRQEKLSCSEQCYVPMNSTEIIRPVDDHDEELINECVRELEKLPPSCFSADFEIHRHTRVSEEFYHNSTIGLHFKTETNCEFFPQISISTFLMIIAGIFDLWFGINLLSSFNKVSDIVIKYKHKIATQNQVVPFEE